MTFDTKLRFALLASLRSAIIISEIRGPLVIYLVKDADDEGVSRLTLFDWRVDGDNEEDLALIFVRKQEKTNN